MQAGLVGILVKEFKVAILVSLIYLGLSIAFHTWSLHVRWNQPNSFWWTNGLLALFCIQRFGELNGKCSKVFHCLINWTNYYYYSHSSGSYLLLLLQTNSSEYSRSEILWRFYMAQQLINWTNIPMTSSSSWNYTNDVINSSYSMFCTCFVSDILK